MALTKAHNRMIEGAAFNVIDFGADPTGVNDSTAAIKAAIRKAARESFGDADKGAPEGYVYFPAGSYIIKETLELTKEIRLVGDGKDFQTNIVIPSDFVPTVDDAVISINGANSTAGAFAFRVSVENMCFKLADTPASVLQFAYMSNCYTVEFKNVWAFYFKKTCYRFDNECNDCYFDRSVMYGTGHTVADTEYAIRAEGRISITCNSIDIEDCYTGVYVAGYANVTLTSPYIERCYHPFEHAVDGANGSADRGGSLTITGGLIQARTEAGRTAGRVRGQNFLMNGTCIQVAGAAPTQTINVEEDFNNISFVNVVGRRFLSATIIFDYYPIYDPFNYAHKTPQYAPGSTAIETTFETNTIGIRKSLVDNTDTDILDIFIPDYSASAGEQQHATQLLLNLTCIGYQSRVHVSGVYKVTASISPSTAPNDFVGGIVTIDQTTQGPTASYPITFTVTLTPDVANNKATISVKSVGSGPTVGEATIVFGTAEVVQYQRNDPKYIQSL
jgi:hypothetical protein